jgi:hypothetical protein
MAWSMESFVILYIDVSPCRPRPWLPQCPRYSTSASGRDRELSWSDGSRRTTTMTVVIEERRMTIGMKIHQPPSRTDDSSERKRNLSKRMLSRNRQGRWRSTSSPQSNPVVTSLCDGIEYGVRFALWWMFVDTISTPRLKVNWKNVHRFNKLNAD